MSHACHRFWKCYKTFTFCSLLTRCTIPCACHAKPHLHGVFSILTSKCALRHNGVHIFDIAASKACPFSTSQLPKVVRSVCVLYILTSKCASRYNGVHFFDIATSKSAPNVRCFELFHLQMCFAPPRHAILLFDPPEP